MGLAEGVVGRRSEVSGLRGRGVAVDRTVRPIPDCEVLREERLAGGLPDKAGEESLNGASHAAPGAASNSWRTDLGKVCRPNSLVDFEPV